MAWTNNSNEIADELFNKKVMSELQTISVQESAKSNSETKVQIGFQIAFMNILKAINANFELLLLIAVSISVLVISIF